jgi:hypothetical protein
MSFTLTLGMKNGKQATITIYIRVHTHLEYSTAWKRTWSIVISCRGLITVPIVGLPSWRTTVKLLWRLGEV